MPPAALSAFAITAPGLEPLCAAELSALGILGVAEPGGVAWSGDLASVARANLWLRTASRVVVRVAEFRARTFFELERHAKQIAWESFVSAATPVTFRVTCRKSKLYHSDAVAQRFSEALARRVPGIEIANTKTNDDETDVAPGNQQLFVVRFLHDTCAVSADSSGELLHRRGYRQQLAKAPLRETLAAAVLLGAGWNGTTPLADPMCGSGTIAIEGARMARRIAPGRGRSFAFLNWKNINRPQWDQMLCDARDGELAQSPVAIEAYDRDAGAIAAARANAERAGVANDITFAVQSISALSAAPAPGLVAINPPYGVRVGDNEGLRNLYAQLGNVMRERRPGWTLAMLSADTQLERQVKLELEERLRTKNGGIPVRVVVTPASP